MSIAGKRGESEVDALRAALASRESQLRNLIERNADGMVVIGEDGCIVFANPAAAALLGKGTPGLWGASFGIPIVPGETTELDIPRTDGSGESLVVEMRVTDTEWEGTPAILATLRDVTDRRRAEQSLRAAEERYRRISEATSDFTYSLSIKPGRHIELEWITEAFTRCTGFTAHEVLKKDWRTLVYSEDVPLVQAHFQRLLTGASDVCEARIYTRSGHLRWLRNTARPVCEGDHGSGLRIYGAGQDVTNRRQLEEELRSRIRELAEMDQRKDSFLAMLAHELRNPLAPIRNSLAVLARTADAATQGEMRSLIEGQVDHLSRILDDLLDVARISKGRVQLRTEVIDLSERARKVLGQHAGLIENAGLTVRADFSAEPLPLDADPVRIDQVLSNLLGNAVKYSEPPGEIHLSTRRQGTEAVFHISDTGIGIEPEMLPRIFDMFAQADCSLDRTRGGLGIGLTLARELIEMHGGRIEAASGGLGKGSEFTVALPLYIGSLKCSEMLERDKCSRAGEERVRDQAGLSQRKLRVLVVDDNVESARSLSLLLKLWEHEPYLLHDGLEAIEAMTSIEPAVVLLDIGLPTIDGYEVARRIRQCPEYLGVRIFAMTGYGHEEDRRRSRASGFDQHLVKPIDLELLEKLLAEVSENAASV